MEVRLPNQPAAVVSKPTGTGLSESGQKPIDRQHEMSNEPGNQNSLQDLEKVIEGLNKWIQTESTHLQFRLHDELNEYYVEVVNDQTNEVIRQIPSKKVLDIAAKMHEMVGLLVDEKR